MKKIAFSSAKPIHVYLSNRVLSLQQKQRKDEENKCFFQNGQIWASWRQSLSP